MWWCLILGGLGTSKFSGVSQISGGFSNFSGGVLQFSGGSPNFGGGFFNFSGGLQFLGGIPPPEYGQRSAGTHPTGMHSGLVNRMTT